MTRFLAAHRSRCRSALSSRCRSAWRCAGLPVLVALVLVLVGWQGFVRYALGLAFPEQLSADQANTALVYDRGGQLLAQVRSDGKLSVPVTRAEIPPDVVDALLVAEDKRFYSHNGIDVWATIRAVGQMVRAGRVVSGASTLTQQLARSTFDRKRSLIGKIRELGLAIRIEAQLEKDEILVAYLNRVEFGPNLVGIGAAAHAYFAKPVAALSLSEAATLVGIPRGPTLYNPKREGSPIQRRRDRILRRLAAHQPRMAASVERALAMPVVLQRQLTWPGAFHWVRRVASEHSGSPQIHTTLDAALQRRVEALVQITVPEADSLGATAAAVLVVDNATREMLAYVGSPRYHAVQTLGQNDGVVALRQPGSALKPFVYASAMKRLGYTAATLLPDIPLEFRERDQVYAPRNYDGRFRGPVRLREALGNSLNVPAVHTAARIGPARLLSDLRDFGFESLTLEPEHYGVALALGDGEVRLEELVAAYAMLANGGVFRRLRLTHGPAQVQGSRVISRPVAGIIADILRDPHARTLAFGRQGPLEFEYPVSVKTGTSKGARDNWTLGFSERVTVGVWVGHFDGRPIAAATGAGSAGPLFHAVMNEAHRHVGAGSRLGAKAPTHQADQTVHLSPEQSGAASLTVCALSGLLPSSVCPVTIREWFVPGTQPTATDTMHVEAPVLHGLLAPHCPAAERRVFERYPPEYSRWAREAGRPTLPEGTLQDCNNSQQQRSPPGEPSVTFPRDGAAYRRVADEPVSRQQLVLRASAAGAATLTYVVDGRSYRTVEAPFEAEWPLRVGLHEVYVVTERGTRSQSVSFSVE